MSHQLTIVVYREIHAICRLEPDAPVPEWAVASRFLSITRTASELSIVCNEAMVPESVHAERNQRLMQVEGTLAFALTGVLASIAAPLATAGIGVFAVSTYDTDYFLVSNEDLLEAAQVLEAAGHAIRQNSSGD
jgi:hypothetical protein